MSSQKALFRMFSCYLRKPCSGCFDAISECLIQGVLMLSQKTFFRVFWCYLRKPFSGCFDAISESLIQGLLMLLQKTSFKVFDAIFQCPKVWWRTPDKCCQNHTTGAKLRKPSWSCMSPLLAPLKTMASACCRCAMLPWSFVVGIGSALFQVDFRLLDISFQTQKPFPVNTVGTIDTYLFLNILFSFSWEVK